MGWSKRQFVAKAFSKIGLGSSVLELSPDQLQDGLSELDGMMATWNGIGIRLGYPLPATPDASGLDDDSGVPDRANEAIYSNLALRLADSVGRPVSTVLLMIASRSYNALLSSATQPPVKQPSMMPAGAGYKEGRYVNRGPFLEPCKDPIEAGPDSDLDFDK